MSIIREVVSWREEMVAGQLYRFEFEPGGSGKAMVDCDGVHDFAVRCMLARANNELKRAVEQGGYLEYRGATYNPVDGLVHGWIRRTSKPFSMAQALDTQLAQENVTTLLAVPPAETLGRSFPLEVRDVANWLGSLLSRIGGGIAFIFRRVWVVVEEGFSAVGSVVAGVGTTARILPFVVIGLAAAIIWAVARGGFTFGPVTAGGS